MKRLKNYDLDLCHATMAAWSRTPEIHVCDIVTSQILAGPVFFNFFIYFGRFVSAVSLVSVVSLFSVVSMVSFRWFRWFRWFRFGRFVSLFRVLVHANEDTLLPTQMFRRLPARATFVADTNFVSGTQKMFLILFRNILRPQQMFPSLHSPRNIMGNKCVLVYQGLKCFPKINCPSELNLEPFNNLSTCASKRSRKVGHSSKNGERKNRGEVLSLPHFAHFFRSPFFTLRLNKLNAWKRLNYSLLPMFYLFSD